MGDKVVDSCGKALVSVWFTEGWGGNVLWTNTATKTDNVRDHITNMVKL